MREAAFLRTPIRADHQGRLRNLMVEEPPLTGNPDPTNAYPQTLILKFDVDASTIEIQVAPLWEGTLYFLARPGGSTRYAVQKLARTGATHVPEFVNPDPSGS
jgi:hypothetical protein